MRANKYNLTAGSAPFTMNTGVNSIRVLTVCIVYTHKVLLCEYSQNPELMAYNSILYLLKYWRVNRVKLDFFFLQNID